MPATKNGGTMARRRRLSTKETKKRLPRGAVRVLDFKSTDPKTIKFIDHLNNLEKADIDCKYIKTAAAMNYRDMDNFTAAPCKETNKGCKTKTRNCTKQLVAHTGALQLFMTWVQDKRKTNPRTRIYKQMLEAPAEALTKASRLFIMYLLIHNEFEKHAKDTPREVSATTVATQPRQRRRRRLRRNLATRA